MMQRILSMRRLLCLLAALLLAAAPAAARLAITNLSGFGAGGASPPPTLTELATNTDTSVTSIALTVPAGGVPAGSLVIVAVGYKNAVTVSSVTDTAGNSYSVAESNTGSTPKLYVWYAQNVSALSSGNTITITFSASANSISAWGGYGSNIAVASALDQHTSTSASTATPSVTTGTTTTAAELVFGTQYIDKASIPVITEAAGYTTLTEVSGTRHLHSAYKIVSTTGTQTYDPTYDTSASVTIAVVTFAGL